MHNSFQLDLKMVIILNVRGSQTTHYKPNTVFTMYQLTSLAWEKMNVERERDVYDILMFVGELRIKRCKDAKYCFGTPMQRRIWENFHHKWRKTTKQNSFFAWIAEKKKQKKMVWFNKGSSLIILYIKHWTLNTLNMILARYMVAIQR